MAPEIQTDRLRIDRLTAADAAMLFAYRSHEDVARYQSWRPESRAVADAFIARNDATPFGADESWYQLAVRLADSDELIGDLGVHFVGDDGHQAEIGFTIAPPYQRRGLGTQAVAALLDHLFVAMGKHRVFASVDPRNVSSLSLLRSVGMREEARFRQSLLWRGEWVDDVIFALLGSEWAGHQAAVQSPGPAGIGAAAERPGCG